MKYNSLRGAPSYFYSFEYQGSGSIYNLLFTSGNVPPVPGGELINISGISMEHFSRRRR